MKRIFLSLIATLVLLCSIISLSSCSFFNKFGKKVDEIDGKKPVEALTLSLNRLEEIDRYDMTSSMTVKTSFVIFPVMTVEIAPMYFFSFDGKNEHHTVPQEAIEKYAKEDLGNIVSETGYSEGWYVDGVCYLIDNSGKYKYTSPTTPFQQSEYEIALKEFLDSNNSELTCYLTDEGYTFTIELEGDELILCADEEGAEKEKITAIITEDGYIKKIVWEMKYNFGIINSTSIMTSEYFYDDLQPISAPQDPSSFTAVQ